jgi:hypothetical protein
MPAGALPATQPPTLTAPLTRCNPHTTCHGRPEPHRRQPPGACGRPADGLWELFALRVPPHHVAACSVSLVLLAGAV